MRLKKVNETIQKMLLCSEGNHLNEFRQYIDMIEELSNEEIRDLLERLPRELKKYWYGTKKEK